MEAIFSRRAASASGFDRTEPGGYRRRLPYLSFCSFPLHLLLGGVLWPTNAARRLLMRRYVCLLCAQACLRVGGSTRIYADYADGAWEAEDSRAIPALVPCAWVW